jgi:uncharacterized Tic20 family protein
MDDQDRINNLEADETPPADPNNEGVPIPSRIREAVDDVRRRIKEEIRQEQDVVQEYEERYYGAGNRSRLETPKDEPPVAVARKPKRRGKHVDVDENERKWAALAHASTLLTALVGLGSAGAGVLLTMLIPLFIYFAFRKRSEYVAFHALQAFTIQLVGTIGWLALLVVGTIVWVALIVIAALLILVLVGIVLLPLVILVYPVFILLSLVLPVGMVIYSVIAAVETWSGNNYRIPYIARWVENQMHSGMLTNL